MTTPVDPVPTGELPASKFEPSVAQLKRASGQRWNALPPVIRSTFDCTRKVSMSQSLRSMGVEVNSSRSLEWAHESMHGTLVVMVWHDHIEVEADGSLSYRIDSLQRQPGYQGMQAERAERMRALLAAHADRPVQVLLLKRGWDGRDTQKVERNAPDLRRWVLEAVGEDRFVLRRTVLRKAT
jgi:hypothetical protein